MTKLLVGLDDAKGGERNTIEIIDLESELTTCQNLTNFPLALEGSFGGLGFQDKPLICGGSCRNYNDSNKCFSLEGNEWINSSSFNSGKCFAAVSPSPYPSSNQKLFVTGGTTKPDMPIHPSVQGLIYNTVEVLTQQGWETLPQILPVTVAGHCSVLVNSTTVLVIGGVQNEYSEENNMSSNTFLFNTETEIWTVGPELKNERGLHSCGRIRKNSQTQDYSIIVVGGTPNPYSGSKMSSVEILDHGANEWRKGPDLPFGIGEAQMVEDQNGGVVLVGGRSHYNTYLDTLYQLPHGGEDAVWTKMGQKLKIGRYNHVAFLVPNDVVDCS
jgi:N-acetylneuraminic acid mutarotase